MKINFNPRILYPAKLSFKIDGAIKVFHDKQKLKQYVTTKPPLQKILQGILHTESETNLTMKRQAAPNHRKRKSNTVESNLHLGTHNQTFKQLRQLNDTNHHIPISTNT
jgi:phage gpG-like protein